MIHKMICMFTESVAYVFGVVEVVWYMTFVCSCLHVC